MNDEPFFYTAGVVVPRGVTRLRIGGVTVVEEGMFRGYQNLVSVEIGEGTREIGVQAFRGCHSLRRVDSPSSLRTIGDEAFAGCLPLSNMNLPEGLQRMGARAFLGHCFGQITIPSSVVEIGVGAFAGGEHLRRVTLTGGTVMMARNAFFGCRQLGNIAIPSEAIVVEDGEHGNGRAAVVTGGTIALHREWEPTRMILTSPYLASMQSEDDVEDGVTRVKDAINRIVGGPRQGASPLDLTTRGETNFTADDWIRVIQGADRIRSRFLGLLSAHRREIVSFLERALNPGVAGIISSFLPDVEG